MDLTKFLFSCPQLTADDFPPNLSADFVVSTWLSPHGVETFRIRQSSVGSPSFYVMALKVYIFQAVNCNGRLFPLSFSKYGWQYCATGNVLCFLFNQQCTIYILLFEQYLYYNHSYMFRYICIILREFQICTSLKLRSSYIIKISLKIIKLKYLCGYCW